MNDAKKGRKNRQKEEISQLFVTQYQEYTCRSTQKQFLYDYGKMPEEANYDKVFSLV